MEFIKSQLKRVQQQLGALGATQKMLAAALVVIMGMTIYWWAKYAGTAEMEPVLDQSLAAEDLSRIKTYLSSKGITYKVDGDRVLVPTDRKMEAIADLAYAQLLPRDTKDAFSEIINKSSPFDSSESRKALWNKAREATLAQVLMRFPQVGNAMVLIDPTEQRRIGGSVQPTASVNLTMQKGAAVERKLVDAAADLVSGAVANLPRSNIKVVIDGVSYPIRSKDPTASSADDWLEQTQEAERRYSDKLMDQLRWLPGAMVSVHVTLNNKTLDEQEEKYDSKGVVDKVTKEDSENVESNTPGRVKDETGAVPNAGMAVNGSSATDGGAKNTNERSSSVHDIRVPKIVRTTRDPGGNVTVTGASVFVPQSYFVGIYKQINGGSGGEPTADAIKPLIDTELPKIREHAASCLGLTDPKAVQVGTYMEATPVVAAPQASAASAVSLNITSHVKEIAVGGLALVSLFIVSMLVRKSSPVLAMAEAPAARAPARLAGSEDPVGEVGEGNLTLDGMELDDDAVKTQQMLDQVSTLVKENPDAAANLVKRWMNRS